MFVSGGRRRKASKKSGKGLSARKHSRYGKGVTGGKKSRKSAKKSAKKPAKKSKKGKKSRR